ncbi:ABC transporter permease [Streptomyces endophyticus]|uniref:ABC transporter permease n=1 Tax=Streptomyces endophyticus TaxID=714166 RepID=A0ABU6F9P9_9ACTN|nr:ABC transporter permease [Streptomyces endophyticus]MEB8340763.1 ABC transporter permease [Streptomyces endophyticus]
MTATTLTPAAPARRRGIHRRLGTGGTISALILTFVVLVAVLGPLLVGPQANQLNLSDAYAAPSSQYWLGQDSSGRDIFGRLVLGARTSLIGPITVVLIATLLGTVLALTAVWFRGWVDGLIVRVLDAIFAFPGLLLAILATALFGAGLSAAVVALAIAYTPYIARIIRSAALQERNLPYIAALQVQGVRGLWVCLRHLLPNISSHILANGTLAFGLVLIDLSGLSFIGLGVQPPTPDWGAMVGDGMPGIFQAYPAESLAAGAAIVVTVAAASILGDRLIESAEDAS